MLRRNMIANVFGSVWGLGLSLVAIPIQIRLLGAEAYGLIGFISVLQLLLVVWDFGLTSIVIREVAADREAGRDVAQTGAAVYWIVALIVGVSVFAAADWIAANWLTVETLTTAYTAGAIRIIAVYLVFTWVISHYANILFGLNRLDVVNALRISLSTGSQVGGIFILLVTPDLHILLLWLTLWSLIGVIAHLVILRRLFPALSMLPRLSIPVVRRIWRASLDMNIVSTAATVYTQADKLLISVLLPLSALGYYNLAYKLLAGISTIPTAISASALPLLTAAHSKGEHATLIAQSDRIARIILYILSGLTFGAIFFGWDVIALWTSPTAADAAYRSFGLLALATLLNGVTSTAYYVLLASGRTRRLAWAYAGGVPPYLIALVVMVALFGIEGAALSLNVYSLYLILSLLPFTRRQFDDPHTLIWINRSFTPFALLGAGIFALARFIAPNDGSAWLWVTAAFAGLTYLLMGLPFLDKMTRDGILRLPGRWLRA